ncbi:MAG: Glucose-1-phosphate adenylyltransferase [Verrucomicrobia subdivision 3 bacterium]|nr:Glucose-1-phosphate adenylyltransferase [Limisphaerales bacterium]MCS1414558.1 Glucose-1-phosphate adenylyltransferase [Limisphaerales bacterium]
MSQLLASDVLCIILGGGAGYRLFPLTKERAKPAVPLGGKYRLVDVPISNCINSGFKRIYVLTQFNSASLHRHISQSYKFDQFGGGFVEILAAEQTPTSTSWYEGTADAVRKNFIHLLNHPFKYLLILSGDQLYSMDCKDLVMHHVEHGAEITVATTPVYQESVAGFGIMEMDSDFRIKRFEEKPSDPELQESLKLENEWYPRLNIEGDQPRWLASMGIYVFNREALEPSLEGQQTDFGKHIIPGAIQKQRVFSYIFQGYWEDVGTIRSFFEANLDLAKPLPQFNLFEGKAPIYTRPRFLPATKINGATIKYSLVADGCVINGATIIDSQLGVRSIVNSGCELNRVVMMGSDSYEIASSGESLTRIGIGRGSKISNAIIDKNARIGENCTISPEGKLENHDSDNFFVRDGIVIVPKNATIPDNTSI